MGYDGDSRRTLSKVLVQGRRKLTRPYLMPYKSSCVNYSEIWVSESLFSWVINKLTMH